MKTKRQKELIESFLSEIGDNLKPIYREIFEYLSSVGYNPHKQRSFIVFKHDLHNKQMAKTGIRKKQPFFDLRFSACRGFSKRFQDIVDAALSKQTDQEASCTVQRCDFCRGEPMTHVYISEGKTRCGAAALEIPNITAAELAEIKKLIDEEHAYLLKHEAEIA
ncbi:MAG: hypothetical protein FWG31_04255 [Oscillospiraceae bacterium]|nr:hypothetical protein [Oscillospiraceae bacterium]